MFPMYPNYNNPYAYKPNNGIQYVNGFESAKAYNLAPNESVILMDSNKSTFYLKQADASGFATVPTEHVNLSFRLSADATITNANVTVGKIH